MQSTQPMEVWLVYGRTPRSDIGPRPDPCACGLIPPGKPGLAQADPTPGQAGACRMVALLFASGAR